MANTKLTPPQNEPEHLAVEGLGAEVLPSSPTLPTGALIAQHVTTVARASQQLSGETVLVLLNMSLTGTSLNEVLTSLTPILEAEAEGMLCSIWLLEKDGLHMRHIAAPSLPDTHVAAIDGFAIPIWA